MRKTWMWLPVLALGWLSTASASFDMSPIVASVSPGGPGASASFTLSNGDDSKTPVQVSLVNRRMDIDGKEKYDDSKDVPDQFQIYPSQLILNPKEKRSVRVTYVGDPKIKRELAFRIVAEEFPINVQSDKKLTKSVATIFLATKYIGSLYVTPFGTKADLKIDATPAKNKSGANELSFTIENRGTAHTILKRPKVIAIAGVGSKEVEIPYDKIPGLQNANLLAGGSRRFTTPWPKDLALGPVKVIVEMPTKQQ